jgi:S-DNA-T family DNA segregation ATPase FtsK/SpoIIIE
MREAFDPRLDLSGYRFPEISLLKRYEQPDKQIDMAEQNANRRRIRKTLEDFGINIISIKATVGPTITLYEVMPDKDVWIAKIKSLEDDIALSLSALGIRIIAPMPGKGTIGIEVPNMNPQIVSFESVVASRKFGESKYELPIALGRTITNEVFMFDLTQMPHLLIAGATGQGKSIGLNVIITSLLYKKHPAELKFVLIDPKMIEFNIYEGIERHYLAKLPEMNNAIITDFTDAIDTLKSLCKEMDNRYDLLANANARNISEYNDNLKKRLLNPLKGHKFMPYIVVVIDEFGDLIMVAGKEIEMPIARIAQKAHTVGIHMIIATQRPSTNIITGTIKANFPARVAFRVSAMLDSRTILDAPGANKLVGRGDLLFSQGGDMIRVQCALVNTDEIESIVEYIGDQPGFEAACRLPEALDERRAEGRECRDQSNYDPLFKEAARLIVSQEQAPTSLIQQKFAIGYNRARRLIDRLEKDGIL